MNAQVVNFLHNRGVFQAGGDDGVRPRFVLNDLVTSAATEKSYSPVCNVKVIKRTLGLAVSDKEVVYLVTMLAES